MSNSFAAPDPEDMFSDSRMSFGEHIEDLRTHLIRAIKGFVLAMLVAFFIAKPVLHFIAKPVEEQLMEYWDRLNRSKTKELQASLDRGDGVTEAPIRLRVRVRRLTGQRAFD